MLEGSKPAGFWEGNGSTAGRGKNQGKGAEVGDDLAWPGVAEARGLDQKEGRGSWRRGQRGGAP